MSARPVSVRSTRLWQLAVAVLCMVSISSPQYAWPLFTQPLQQALGASLASLQVTFSLLIVVQTFLAPAQGLLVDRAGPRLLLSLGAVLIALSWILAARASSLTALYLSYGVLGGLGTGIVYVGVIGHVARWFPERRGFATGIAAAGYGVGAIATTFPIDTVIRTKGYPTALAAFGLVFGFVGVLAAQALRPARESVPASGAAVTGVPTRDVPPSKMLRHKVFWLMFLMMSMMSTGGLMVTSQMGAFARDIGLAGALVFGLPLLPLALSVDRVTNGLTRPFFGWVSDRVGRETTMTIAFSLEAAAMSVWLLTRGTPVLFVLMSGLVFFGWGEIFSLFPSTLTDTFGSTHATTNYGFLYIAQGLGSIAGGPLAALLHELTGSWLPVFACVIVMDGATALLAQCILRPWRRRAWAVSLS
jgi:oxalate/formate antiporter